MMRAALQLVTIGLSVQATFGEINVRAASKSQEATSPSNVNERTPLGLGTMPTDINGALSPEARENLEHRRLALGPIVFTSTVTFTVTSPDIGTPLTIEQDIGFDANGECEADLVVPAGYFNEDETDLCSGCALTAEIGDCISGACPDNDDIQRTPIIEIKLFPFRICILGFRVYGDPHMVGLLGQKIDWAGVDNAWYCLLSDGPDFQVNVRLSAPMPEEFPDRQLISAVSLLSTGGHSLVVEVRNPYSTGTDGCPEGSSAPCLAEGGLRILVDGEESAALQVPAENVRLPGGKPIVLSAANLPAECQPFGGDRIWAAHYAEFMASHRNLRAAPVDFNEWILQPDTLAAPTWCAKFLEEEGSAGLLSTRSKHATLRVETPVAALRISVGVNYQDLQTASDGTVLVPELEFWQTDLGFDDVWLSENVAGLMGDTSRFALDAEGMPVTSGLGALHGPVESYRVSGPFALDFENMHG